ncbi:carboxypeptidase regulatory-like domain-containing protein [Alkalihalobacillus sp. MEB130]|uniref:leucine-rich repeat domain-containing protein n=1 Tax=Alkalihalobacillus sp. MEB130 TaxID=2976704 RepID=UPI0028DD6EB4|nr:leucine-rich repeat domain-containing protein [Alkalihalobacillus sp. MEB130]MDT8860356.1 carboxypeptidase regulatory-like domain-containing protein [Alkalihalobacillus sp. MEB130]
MKQAKWLNVTIIFTLIFQFFAVPLGAVEVKSQSNSIHLKEIFIKDEKLRIEWELEEEINWEEADLTLEKNGEVTALTPDQLEVEQGTYVFYDKEADLDGTYTYAIVLYQDGQIHESNLVTYAPELLLEEVTEESQEAEELTAEEAATEEEPTAEEAVTEEEATVPEEEVDGSSEEEVVEEAVDVIQDQEDGLEEEPIYDDFYEEDDVWDNGDSFYSYYYHQYDENENINLYEPRITDESFSFSISFNYQNVGEWPNEYRFYLNDELVPHSNHYILSNMDPNTEYTLRVEAISYEGELLVEREFTVKTTDVVESEEAVILDENLEEAVRSELGIQSRALTVHDLEQIKRLHIYHSNISDLTGLEHAKNLESLYANNNNITNLEPLSTLTNLSFINVNNNEIEDLLPVTKMEGLGYLQIESNKLTNINLLLEIERLYAVAITSNALDLSDGSDARIVIETLQEKDVHVAFEFTQEFNLNYYIGDVLIDLTWDIRFDDSHIASFEVFVDEVNVGAVGRDTRNFEITGLEPETTYIIEVVAIGYDGMPKNTSWTHEIITASEPRGEIVTFEDATLEQRIRERLWVHGREIRDSDLEDLTSLSIYWQDISSLSGLEHATNLRSLYLHGLSVDDLSPIYQLEKLEELSLYDMGLEEISWVTNLSELRHLSLSYNNITDISPILELTKLESLDIWGNSLDLSLQSKTMEQIAELKERGVEVAYPRPEVYSGFVSDESVILYWYFDEYEGDIDSYQVMVNGQGVDLISKDDYYYGRYILTELDPETEYNITIVGLRDGELVIHTNTLLVKTKRVPSEGTEVTFADSNLEAEIRRTFGFEHRSITEDDMKELSYLSIYYNDISDLKGLETAVNLRGFYLYGGSVTNIDVLAELPQLRDLHLSDLGIEDLSVLTSLTNLSYLSLTNMDLEDISFVSEFTNLYDLNLSNNNITDISPLQDHSVYYLLLNNNQIEDLTPLLSLLNLTDVALWGNLIDFSEGTPASQVVKELEKKGVYVEKDQYHYQNDVVISDFTSTTITVDIDASANGWSYDSYTIFVDDEIVFDLDGSTQSFTIEGLEPNRTYEISMNMNGDGFSDFVYTYVTTLAVDHDDEGSEEPIEEPTPKPVTYQLTVSDIASKSFLLDWEAAATDYEAENVEVYLSNELVAELDDQTTSYAIEGLNPNTWYSVKVKMFKGDEFVELNRTIRTRTIERTAVSFKAENQDGEAVDRQLEFYLEGTGPHNKHAYYYGYTNEEGFLRLWHQSSTTLDIPVGTYDIYIFGNGKYQDTLLENIEINLDQDYVDQPVQLVINQIDLELSTLDISVLDTAGNPIEELDYISIYSPSIVSSYNYSFGYKYEWDPKSATGQYSFADMAHATDYQISIGAEGYRTYNGNFNFSEGLNALEVVLEIGATVKGSVVTESGNAIIGANVYASNNNIWEYADTKTGGEFIIQGVEAGNLVIDVSMTGFESKRIELTEADFEENVANIGEVTLSPERYVEGFLLDQDNKPARNVSVMLHLDGSSWSSYWARTDQNGYFKFRNVADNTYTLRTESFNYPNIEVDSVIPKNEAYTFMLLEEGTGSFVGEGNRFSSSVTTVVPGNTMRYRLDYKNNGSEAAEHVVLDLALSENVELLEETILLNGKEKELTDGKLVLDRIEAGEAGVLRFQAKVKENVSSQILSRATIAYGDDEVRLSATTNVLFVTMQAPEVTATSKVKVYGTAKVGSKVEVYDGQRLLGQTTVTSRWWYMDVNLPVREGTESTHNLVAKVTEDNEVFYSDAKTLSYQPDVASLEEVTVHAGWNSGVTLNPNTGVATFAIVEFTPIDLEVKFDKQVDEVNMHFIGETYELTYDAQKQTYVGQFPPGWSSYGEQLFEISFIQGETETRLPLMEVIVLIDPSGYVFEGSMDNRLQGATAIVEEYRREQNIWRKWDAEFFGQINPQITDERGRYGWDVVQGEWRVIFSKEGYETYISRIVEVPPEETELNVPLVRLSEPEVEFISYEEGTVTVVFDRLMNEEDVEEYIRVLLDGEAVEGTFELEGMYGYQAVEEGSGYYEPNEDQLLSQTFVWTPNEPLVEETTYVVIVEDISDYDGKTLGTPYQTEFTTEAAVIEEPADEESENEQPKDEESENEQPKDEESGSEQPKDEELGSEQSKDEEPGSKQPKDEESGSEQPKDEESGSEQPKDKEPASEQSKDEESGSKQPKDEESGSEQPKDKETGSEQPKDKESGSEQPKDKESGNEQPKDKESGSKQPKDKESGNEQPKDKESGSEQPKDKESGSEQPKDKEAGSKQPKDKESGSEQSKDKESGSKQPKDEESGSEQPKDKESGSEQPKDKESGSKQPKDEESGSEQSKDKESGSKQPKDEESGSEQPKDKESGSERPKDKESRSEQRDEELKAKEPTIEKPQDSKEAKDSEKNEQNQETTKKKEKQDIMVKPRASRGQVTLELKELEQVPVNGTITIDLQRYEKQSELSLILSSEQVALLKKQNVTIILDKGDVSLSIKAAIFTNGNEEVRVNVKKLKDIKQALSSVYDFKIHQGDQIISQFEEAIVLAFKVDTKKVSNPEAVKLFYWNETKQEWELMGGTYEEGLLIGETPHFSTFTVFELTEDELASVSDNVTPEEQSGSQLPFTATGTYNFLLLGVILVAIGLIFSRRFKVVKE